MKTRKARNQKRNKVSKKEILKIVVNIKPQKQILLIPLKKQIINFIPGLDICCWYKNCIWATRTIWKRIKKRKGEEKTD
jgi:hypothetical protein